MNFKQQVQLRTDTQIQRRNEVRCRPGQEASLAPSCSNLRSLGSKCTVLKVLVTLLFLSASPELFGVRGIVLPLSSSLHPYVDLNSENITNSFYEAGLLKTNQEKFRLDKVIRKDLKN